MCGVGNVSTIRQLEMRNSRRFPIHLQVMLKASTEEYCAKTIDISADGVLFHTEAAIQIGSVVLFGIEIPREALGTERPVLVNCQDRVVRCSEEPPGWNAAVVIDEYEFNRVNGGALIGLFSPGPHGEDRNPE